MLKKTCMISCFVLPLIFCGCKKDTGFGYILGKCVTAETSLGEVTVALHRLSSSDGRYYCMPIVLFVVNKEEYGLPEYGWNVGPSGNFITMFSDGKKIEGEGVVVFYKLETKQYRVLEEVLWTPELFDDEEKAKAFIREIVESYVIGIDWSEN